MMNDEKRLTTAESGQLAHLTASSMLCGFAFAGLILYLTAGDALTSAAHISAACVLGVALVALLWSTCLMVWSITRRTMLDRDKHSDAKDYWTEAQIFFAGGVMALLVSVSIMGFIASTLLGWVVAFFAFIFVARVFSEVLPEVTRP